MKRSTIFSALALVAAVLLVAGAPAPSGHETAKAQSGGEVYCTAADFLAADGSFADNLCSEVSYDASESYDAVSLYQAALQTDSSANQWYTLLDNYLQNTEEVAWLRAERALARAVENGSTQTAANVDVTESVKDYYTIHEINLYDKWNLHVKGADSYENEASNISGYTVFNYPTTETWDEVQDTQGSNAYVESISYVGQSNVTHTLANGSSMTVRGADFSVTVYSEYAQKSNTETVTVTPFDYNKTITVAGDSGDTYPYALSFEVRYWRLMAPNSDYENRNYLSLERTGRFHNDIRTQMNHVTNETDTFVANTWADFDSGNLNSTEVLSKVNLLFNYGQNTQNTENATFSEATVALSALGVDEVGADETAYMNISYQRASNPTVNVTNEGLLLSESAPGGSFQTGVWYDSNNITGPQMVVTLSGEQHTINGTFKIHDVYREDGTTISNPGLTPDSNDYQVSNTTEVQEMLDRLDTLINEYENRTTDDSGSGTTGGSNSIDLSNAVDGALSVLNSVTSTLFGWKAKNVAEMLAMFAMAGALLLLGKATLK